MAKDKVKICIGETVRIDTLYTISNHWHYVNTKDSDYWFCKIGNYYIHYSLIPGTNNIGYLTIDFSISKLLNGDNALPTTQVNPYTIKERIYSDLKTVLNFKSNTILDFEEWTISKDETFFDIIASKEIIEGLMHLIEHSDISRRTIDSTYRDNGSIYIHSGSTREKASWTLIAYDKVREGARRGVDIVKVKGLKEDQHCLRIELKTKSYGLKKLLKEFKHKPKALFNLLLINFKFDKAHLELLNNDKYIFDYEMYQESIKPFFNKDIKSNFNTKYFNQPFPIEYINNIIQPPPEKYFKFIKRLNARDNKSHFTDSIDKNFEAYSLNKVLKDLNLFNNNIKILGRKDLVKFIKESGLFKTPTTINNAKKVIKVLNGKGTKSNCITTISSKTIKKYKNLLLDAGVHYLHVDHHIPEISQAMLDKAIYETGNLVIE